jgi:hypothetical protein
VSLRIKQISVKATDQITVAELPQIFGFPLTAIIAAIEKHKAGVSKPFYSIPDLATRWNCSRATVYNVLRETEFKLLDLSRQGKDKGKWLIPAAVVERIEQSRMERLPETTAA